MSYSFSRDRTAELRGSTEEPVENNSRANKRGFLNNPFQQQQQQQSTSSGSPSLSTRQLQQPHDWGYSPTNESFEMTQQQQQQPQQPADLTTTPGFFEYLDQLKYEIDSINNNIDQIGNLHNAALSSFNEQQSKQTAQQLDNIKQETQRKNMNIKASLQELENSNGRIANAQDLQMRRSQTAAIKKRFIDTIQRYQDVERNYQLKYRQRIERQIRIVKPDADQDEIDDIIDSDDTPQIFAQSLMSAGRQGQSKAVLSEVQNRHDDIKHIEKTIVELHQLFMDMQMMVEQQGEVLQNVEVNAEDTAVNIKEGNTQLHRAIALAKSTRAKKWCCFFLCIGICVMIAILVWWFGFGHVGVGGGSNNNNNTPATTTIYATPTPSA